MLLHRRLFSDRGNWMANISSIKQHHQQQIHGKLHLFALSHSGSVRSTVHLISSFLFTGGKIRRIAFPILSHLYFSLLLSQKIYGKNIESKYFFSSLHFDYRHYDCRSYFQVCSTLCVVHKYIKYIQIAFPIHYRSFHLVEPVCKKKKKRKLYSGKISQKHSRTHYTH